MKTNENDLMLSERVLSIRRLSIARDRAAGVFGNSVLCFVKSRCYTVYVSLYIEPSLIDRWRFLAGLLIFISLPRKEPQYSFLSSDAARYFRAVLIDSLLYTVSWTQIDWAHLTVPTRKLRHPEALVKGHTVATSVPSIYIGSSFIEQFWHHLSRQLPSLNGQSVCPAVYLNMIAIVWHTVTVEMPVPGSCDEYFIKHKMHFIERKARVWTMCVDQEG